MGPCLWEQAAYDNPSVGNCVRPRYNVIMTTLALNEMSLAEKLAAMEALWEDLSRTPEAVESPAWHKEVLEQRQNRVAEGKTGYTSWESAKADIRRQVS